MKALTLISIFALFFCSFATELSTLNDTIKWYSYPLSATLTSIETPFPNNDVCPHLTGKKSHCTLETLTTMKKIIAGNIQESCYLNGSLKDANVSLAFQQGLQLAHTYEDTNNLYAALVPLQSTLTALASEPDFVNKTLNFQLNNLCLLCENNYEIYSSTYEELHKSYTELCNNYTSTYNSLSEVRMEVLSKDTSQQSQNAIFKDGLAISAKNRAHYLPLGAKSVILSPEMLFRFISGLNIGTFITNVKNTPSFTLSNNTSLINNSIPQNYTYTSASKMSTTDYVPSVGIQNSKPSTSLSPVSSKSSNNNSIIIGCVVGIGGFLILCAVFAWYLSRQRKKHFMGNAQVV